MDGVTRHGEEPVPAPSGQLIRITGDLVGIQAYRAAPGYLNAP